MTSILVVLASASACHTRPGATSGSGDSAPAAAVRIEKLPANTPTHPDAGTDTAGDLPPDGQLLRDAAGAVSPAEIRALGSSGFKKLRVVSKEVDEYEKDECNTIVEGKIVPYGPKIKVFGRYTKKGSFWKLVDQQAKGY
jgi:hypothetical protein